MEFVRETHWGDPVLGKYKYVYSSGNGEHVIFQGDPYYDSVSKRWFEEFKYTYCTHEGYAEATDGDEMDKIGFWELHPDAKMKESYYEWCYTDAPKVTYHIAEYEGSRCRRVAMETAMDEAVFQRMARMLHTWHCGGPLEVDGVVIVLGPWEKNPYVHDPIPDMADNTAVRIRQRASVDIDIVVRDLQLRTSIVDSFIRTVAAIICEHYNCMRAEPDTDNFSAAILYERLIHDTCIKNHPWMFCGLKEVLLEPIPFA